MTGSKCNVVVLASGTGTNFKAIALACRQESFPARVAGLVTDNPQAGALKIARDLGVESFCVPAEAEKGRLPEEAEAEITGICKKLSADLIALAGFMRILKGPLLTEYHGRVINIHPALLPSFKGLHAQRQALEYGVKVAGCSVHFVDNSIDGGPIILQAAVPVEDDDNEETLSQRILKEEHRIYVQTIKLFSLGRLKIEGRRVRIIKDQ